MNGVTLRWVDVAGQERVIGDVRSLPFSAVARARRLRVWPLRGGLNHGVFALELDGRLYCLKLYADAARSQPMREVWALERLAALGLAPRLVDYVYHCPEAPHGAILMEYVSGPLLYDSPPGAAGLARLLFAAAAIHAVAVSSASPTWLAEGYRPESPASSLERMAESYEQVRRRAEGAIATRQLEALDDVLRAAHTVASRPLPAPPGLALCRSDPSLANVVVRPSGRLCFLDWEYCGRGDPAWEYAEYVHHPTSEGIPREDWLAALTSYEPARGDSSFVDRFERHDLIVGVVWCLRLARQILAVAAGDERWIEKSRVSLVGANRARLAARLETIASRLA